jgi:hypothetical protein
MGGGVHLAAAPPRRHKTRGRSCGGLRARVGGELTGVTVWLLGEARKGFERTLGLWGWGAGIVGYASAAALCHTQWSIRQSHSRAISPSW